MKYALVLLVLLSASAPIALNASQEQLTVDLIDAVTTSDMKKYNDSHGNLNTMKNFRLQDVDCGNEKNLLHLAVAAPVVSRGIINSLLKERTNKGNVDINQRDAQGQTPADILYARPDIDTIDPVVLAKFKKPEHVVPLSPEGQPGNPAPDNTGAGNSANSANNGTAGTQLKSGYNTWIKGGAITIGTAFAVAAATYGYKKFQEYRAKKANQPKKDQE